MKSSSLLIVSAKEVAAALAGLEADVIDAVRVAYLTHHAGRTSLPHSVFLRFGEDNPSRIIGLPAYLGDQAPIAGMKWIASFPTNTARGIDRASAVIILNSMETGRPIAVLESSIISSRRTAASAALAARALHPEAATTIGLIGCGLINFEVLRFLRHVFPALHDVVFCDIDPRATRRFTARVRDEFPHLNCRAVSTSEEAFRSAKLVSIATVASDPHIESGAGLGADSTVLHLSLRDLAPAVIRQADNVVDDADHVLRARTSLHLTELEDGNREFVRGTLADVLCDEMPPRVKGRPCVFSPFGLGFLDLALARLVLRESDGGTEIRDFLPASRAERVEYRRVGRDADCGPLVKFLLVHGERDTSGRADEVAAVLGGLGNGKLQVWMATIDGECVGLIAAADGGTESAILEQAVHSDHRAIGIEAGLLHCINDPLRT